LRRFEKKLAAGTALGGGGGGGKRKEKKSTKKVVELNEVCGRKMEKGEKNMSHRAKKVRNPQQCT